MVFDSGRANLFPLANKMVMFKGTTENLSHQFSRIVIPFQFKAVTITVQTEQNILGLYLKHLCKHATNSTRSEIGQHPSGWKRQQQTGQYVARFVQRKLCDTSPFDAVGFFCHNVPWCQKMPKPEIPDVTATSQHMPKLSQCLLPD